MKKVFWLILFIILMIISFNIKQFKKEEFTTYYSLEDAQDLKTINIDAENVILRFQTNPFDEIALKRTTTKKQSEDIIYSSNYIDGELLILQSKVNEPKLSIKDEINIQIPQDSLIDNFNLKLNGGSVSLIDLNVKNMQIKSLNNLKLNIDNANFKNLQIVSKVLDSNIQNTIIKDKIKYDVTAGNIVNKNVNGNEEEINNKSKLKYKNLTSYFSETRFNDSNVLIQYEISRNKDYYFNDVKNKINDNFLDSEGTEYKYDSKTTSIDKYNIFVNNNRVERVILSEKQEKEDEVGEE